MYLTPRRIETQLNKADHLMRILWRLYSPYREHRKLIVKASYYLMEVVSLLEQLKKQVDEDISKEMSGKLVKPQTPPGYYDPNKAEEKQDDSNQQEKS